MAEKDSWAVGSDVDRRIDVEDARAALAAFLSSAGGIATQAGFTAGSGNPGQVTASGTPDANVTVAAFQYVIPNSRGMFPYVATLDSPKTIDVLVANPSDPTNPRRDLIIAQQSDAYYGDASSAFEVKRITGTPAASPSDPVVTGSPDYILLARITVTAGATTITSGMITDLRTLNPRVVARGGVLPCTSSTRPPNPYGGMVIHETDTGKVLVRNGTTAAWEEIFTATSNQMTTALPIRTTTAADVSLSSTTHGFQIGPTGGVNLRADGEEIQAVNNGAANTLRLNALGGLVQIGPGGLDCDGTSNFDEVMSLTPTASANSQAIAFNQGHSIYVDNVNIAGAAGSRFWLDMPDNADVVIGPRAGADFINEMRLRCDATTTSAANMFWSSSNYSIARSTSSLRYKVDVVDLTLDLATIRQLRPVRFRDRGEVERDPSTTQTHVGFIAEEVHDLGLHEFVHYHEDAATGEVWADGVQYDRFVTAHHLLIRDLEATVADQAAQITALQDALAALTSRVEALEGP